MFLVDIVWVIAACNSAHEIIDLKRLFHYYFHATSSSFFSFARASERASARFFACSSRGERKNKKKKCCGRKHRRREECQGILINESFGNPKRESLIYNSNASVIVNNLKTKLISLSLCLFPVSSLCVLCGVFRWKRARNRVRFWSIAANNGILSGCQGAAERTAFN